MAPLAQTLALLAMAVATVAIEKVNLNMAKNSFDDQYLKCSDSMTKRLLELQCSDFLKNSEFAKNWTKATEEWEKRKVSSSPLTPEQAIALMAYTTRNTKLHEVFNAAVHEAGRSSQKYWDEFHFKSLHFLLTRALQTLSHPNDCQVVFRRVNNYLFNVNQGDEVRFGQFTLASRSDAGTQTPGEATVFKMHTCHGADIQKFSKDSRQEEVLIPPFETFRVTGVGEFNNMKNIELKSTGTYSNYDCEWLKGGSLPRTSPQLWGLLLVTVAMAVVSGTL